MARSLNDFLNEDTNQFGPGTDLIVALLAVLLVLTAVTSELYRTEREREPETIREGDFHLASEAFPAGEFKTFPVTELADPSSTEARVLRIVADYRAQTFPYLFVIGHANQIDARDAQDTSTSERRQRNWEYAGRRAAKIAEMIAGQLLPRERDRLVVMSTGEFDMRDPEQPRSRENAWVEVVFGKEWKPPSRAVTASVAADSAT